MARVSAVAAFPPAVEVSSCYRGVPTLLAVPAVADLPALVGFPAIVGFPAVAGVPSVAGYPVVVVALLLLLVFKIKHCRLSGYRTMTIGQVIFSDCRSWD
jgi:hypothetical protein